ncbi:MAG: hypothetical protein N3D11_02780 [Candidatus Sumerlaeia bacterium]|nr:hypothetical protein [Candidatus Sumerlaeia bacterium]
MKTFSVTALFGSQIPMAQRYFSWQAIVQKKGAADGLCFGLRAAQSKNSFWRIAEIVHAHRTGSTQQLTIAGDSTTMPPFHGSGEIV